MPYQGYLRFNFHTILFVSGFVLSHFVLFGLIFYRFNLPLDLLLHPNFLKGFVFYHALLAAVATIVGGIIAIIPFYQWDYSRRWFRSALITWLVLEGGITILLSWGYMKILSIFPLIDLLKIAGVPFAS